MLEWVGDGFDPDVLDAEALTANVAALARRWSQTNSSKRARPV